MTTMDLCKRCNDTFCTRCSDDPAKVYCDHCFYEQDAKEFETDRDLGDENDAKTGK